MSIALTKDRIRADQPYITTENNEWFDLFLQALKDPEATPTMGCVTAKSGMGKTIAISKYIAEHTDDEFVRGLPSILHCKVPLNNTSVSVGSALLEAAGERVPPGGNRQTIVVEVIKAIKNNGIKTVFVDEGDRLAKDSFEAIRDVYEGVDDCVFVVVGLPKLATFIETYEQFDSRVGMRMQFDPPSLQEVLETILPNTVIPGWEYDSTNDEHRSLGVEAWRMTGTFRRLHNLLERACSLCRIQGVQLDKTIMQKAFRLTASKREKRNYTKQSQSKGILEKESEKRSNAKQQKKKKSRK